MPSPGRTPSVRPRSLQGCRCHLTKLDGTAKGGCVVAVKQRLGLPVRFIGVGEGIDDLLPFTPEGFVEELLPREWKH